MDARLITLFLGSLSIMILLSIGGIHYKKRGSLRAAIQMSVSRDNLEIGPKVKARAMGMSEGCIIVGIKNGYAEGRRPGEDVRKSRLFFIRSSGWERGSPVESCTV